MSIKNKLFSSRSGSQFAVKYLIFKIVLVKLDTFKLNDLHTRSFNLDLLGFVRTELKKHLVDRDTGLEIIDTYGSLDFLSASPTAQNSPEWNIPFVDFYIQ